MRKTMLMMAAAVVAGGTTVAGAQDAFDACEVFTQAEAQKAATIEVREKEPSEKKLAGKKT